MSAPLLDTLNAMNLDEFSAYIDSLIKRTMDGGMLSREETTALLDLEPDSPKAVIMEQKAGAMAKTVTNGTGRIWSAVGVDRHPCTMNCKFCSLGKQWGLIKDTAEWPVEDIREAARLAGEHHASWFVLRTTEFYSLERLTKLASDIRAILPESCQLVVNTGELTHETADKLVNAGVCGVYHTLRLREGKDTCFDPALRLATLATIRDSRLELYHMAEPLGIEHSSKEITDRIFVGHEYHAALGGIMLRVSVKGTPFGETPMVSDARHAQAIAVCRIFAGSSVKNICTSPPSKRTLEAGANVTPIEIGAVPRSAEVDHGSAWNGLGLVEARALLESAGYHL